MDYYSITYSIPYMIFFSLLVVLCVRFSNSGSTLTRKSIDLFYFFILFFSFIFFIGFRGFIYTDWITYYDAFRDTPSLFADTLTKDSFFKKYPSWGKGYILYSMFFKTFLPDYFLFQSVSFLIDFVILFFFFKRYFSNLNLVIMAFAFFFLFYGVLAFGIEVNLMRNAKSIMCFLISIRYIEKRSFFPFLLFNLLGFTFHTTSLIFIPFYFILRWKIPKRIVIVFFVIGNLFYLLQFQWIKELLKFINSTVHTPFSEMIEVYLRMKKYSGAWGFSIGYIERIFSFFLIFIFQDKLLNLNDKNRIIINSFYIYMMIYLYCSEMSILLNRVGLLFSFGYWILFPQVYSLLSKKRKIYFLVVFFIYGILKCAACNTIMFYYENVFFPHKSYEQRYFLLYDLLNNI